MAAVDADGAGLQPRDRLLAAGGQALELRRADDGLALAAVVALERQRRARREDELACEAGHDLAGGADVDQHRLGRAEAAHGLGVGCGAVAHSAVTPPSATIVVPVMYEARSESRNSTISAISSTVPRRRSGTVGISASSPPETARMDGLMGTAM